MSALIESTRTTPSAADAASDAESIGMPRMLPPSSRNCSRPSGARVRVDHARGREQPVEARGEFGPAGERRQVEPLEGDAQPVRHEARLVHPDDAVRLHRAELALHVREHGEPGDGPPSVTRPARRALGRQRREGAADALED